MRRPERTANGAFGTLLTNCAPSEICRTTDRPLKVSPAGGLRPALTALPGLRFPKDPLWHSSQMAQPSLSVLGLPFSYRNSGSGLGGVRWNSLSARRMMTAMAR